MTYSKGSPYPVLASLILARWPLAESIELQEEPSAGKPHARICEGKSRMASVLDHCPWSQVLGVENRQSRLLPGCAAIIKFAPIMCRGAYRVLL